MAVSRSARSASRKERGYYWNLNEGSVNFEEEYEEDISLSSEGVYKVERLIDKRKIKVSQSSTERRHLSVHSRPATPSLVSMV